MDIKESINNYRLYHLETMHSPKPCFKYAIHCPFWNCWFKESASSMFEDPINGGRPPVVVGGPCDALRVELE